jgi:alpha-ketoglutarate-dependent taurine dioxygenase
MAALSLLTRPLTTSLYDDKSRLSPVSSYGLDSVNVTFLPSNNHLYNSKALSSSSSSSSSPSLSSALIISPRWESSLDFLKRFLEANREWISQRLAIHGAILLRGFDIDNAVDLQTAIQSYNPQLSNTYRGTSPRNVLDSKAPYVFSAAEVPTHYPIAQHLEMSFLPEPPSQLYFGCLQPSQTTGGETALCDFRAVARELPTELQAKLLSLGIRYTRTHTRKGRYYTYDVSEMLGWEDLFGTQDKASVEQICRDEGTPFEWTGPNKDVFVSVTHSPAFQVHPVTGHAVWFNHAQVFHWTTFAAELWFAFRRTHELRLLLHFLWIALYSGIRYGLLRHKMSLQADFGDGSPISVWEMHQIRTAIHRNMVFSRWHKGDLLLLDNFSTSHGRQPTYDKGRKIAVAWAVPMRKSNEVVTLEALLSGQQQPQDLVSSGMGENPQERTPDTTLTRYDAAILQEQVNAQEGQHHLLAKALEAAHAHENQLQSLFHRSSRHARSKSACY